MWSLRAPACACALVSRPSERQRAKSQDPGATRQIAAGNPVALRESSRWVPVSGRSVMMGWAGSRWVLGA